MIVNRAFCNNNKEHKQDLYRVGRIWFKCKGNEKSNAVIFYKAVYEKPLQNKK